LLANAGATILFQGSLPTAPPGIDSSESTAQWNELAGRLSPEARPGSAVRATNRGAGRVLVASDLAALMEAAKLRRESWRAPGRLNFVRRKSPAGHMYFIKNESKEAFDGWITPSVEWNRGALLFDPLNLNLRGAAETRTDGDGQEQFRLQLAAGQTKFVNVLRGGLPFRGGGAPYLELVGDAVPITGRWSVEFIAGGPELPPASTTDRLESWSRFAGAEGERFAGTARYAVMFDAPDGAGIYALDLGRVGDSARVELNGRPVATLITAPFQCDVELAARDNRLVVEVTNVAANRIRDLDRRGVPWKIFKDINVVGINYRPLDASRWPIREAGLLGPVTLQRLKRTQLE
jgi:hypothetical protein